MRCTKKKKIPIRMRKNMINESLKIMGHVSRVVTEIYKPSSNLNSGFIWSYDCYHKSV